MGFFENMFGAPQETPSVTKGGDESVVGYEWSATPSYSDPAVSYANARQSQAQLGFKHIPSGKEVYFMAFVTDISDVFSSDWNEQKVYGRMDPIMTFRGTSRKISVSWDIPADSVTTGFLNLRKCEGLIKFLYPAYDTTTGASSISKSPLIRLKFANLIAKGMGDSILENGLLGTLSGLTFTPDMDAGFFDTPNVVQDSNGKVTGPTPGTNIESVRGPTGTSGALAPKVIKLSCEFNVLHERELGWGYEGNPTMWRDQNTNFYFPYQAGYAGDAGGDFGSNMFSNEGIELPIDAVLEGTDSADSRAATETILNAEATNQFDQAEAFSRTA